VSKNKSSISEADNIVISLVTMIEEARIAREILRKNSPPSARFVTVNKFSELTGYTDGAVRGKISGGTWIEGVEYNRAPDGGILINMEAYDTWVQGQSHAVNQ